VSIGSMQKCQIKPGQWRCPKPNFVKMASVVENKATDLGFLSQIRFRMRMLLVEFLKRFSRKSDSIRLQSNRVRYQVVRMGPT